MHLTDVLRSVQTAKRMEKIAAEFPENEELVRTAAGLKVLLDAEVMSLAKTAAFPADALKSGLAWGAGAAVPVTAGGALLLANARHNAAETTADIRDKVLQTAAGLSAVGAGLYGLQRMTSGEKTGSADEGAVEELVEKLAAAGAVEELLAGIDRERLSKEAQDLLDQVCLLNRSYATELLSEASGR